MRNSALAGAGLAALLAIAIPAGALAHGYKVRTLEIIHPWTQPPPSRGAALLVCMILKNKGTRADRLLSATSPLAKAVLLQSAATPQDGGAAAFSIPAGGTLEMQRDGQRLVLEGVSKAVSPNDMVPLSLVFEHAGRIDVEVMVEE
jgi:copper(I)-binding protein